MSKEAKALDTLLNKGVKFNIGIRVFGIKINIPFRIKPLRLGTILFLSKQRLKLKEVSDEKEPVWEMFDKAENVKPFAKCVAISVLNSPLKIKIFSGLLSCFFLWKLTIKEIQDIMAVVVSQMNPRDFFFTTALVRGIQIVDRRKTQNISQKKQSSVQSEKYRKS